MADHRPNKGWLVFFGVSLFLALAYVGYGRWRHSQLNKALRDPDPVVRIDAVRKAGKEGYADLLVKAMKDDDPDIRCVAAGSLRSVGSHDAEQVRALLEASNDEHKYVREKALDTLRYLPARARKYIYKAVDEQDPRFRAGAAYALVYVPGEIMGREDPPPRPPQDKQIVVSLMTHLLKDDNVEVRKAASFCLFSYHLEIEEALRVRSALEQSPEETDQDARDLADRLKRVAEQQSR